MEDSYVSGIISLDGIDISDIKFNSNQVSAVYYNGVCIWALEEENIPDNAIVYDDKYIKYDDLYIVYKEEK